MCINVVVGTYLYKVNLVVYVLFLVYIPTTMRWQTPYTLIVKWTIMSF